MVQPEEAGPDSHTSHLPSSIHWSPFLINVHLQATLCTADRMIIPDTYAPKGTADPMKASQQQG